MVGATGSGKTTLIDAILAELAQIAPDDRVISIEDTTELQCAVSNYVDLRAATFPCWIVSVLACG